MISARTVDNTGGDSNKTSFEKHKSVKPEAHLSLANGEFTPVSNLKIFECYVSC